MELEQPPGPGTPERRSEAGEPPVADAVVDSPVARPSAEPAASEPAASEPAPEQAPANGRPRAETQPLPEGEPPADGQPAPERRSYGGDRGGTEEPTAAGAEQPPRQPTKPKKTKRGPGRNLPIAIGVGAALGAMVLLGVYLVQWIFIAIMVVFLGVAVRELATALAGRGIRVPLVPLLLGGPAMLVLSYATGPTGLMAAFGLTVLVILVWRMPAGSRDYLRDTTAGIFTAVYVPFLGGFAALMLASDDGPDRIITFIAITVASDIGGFFAGTFLGRHKLAPSISPKKTWEGLAGSALTCMAIGALLLPLLLDGHVWQGVVLGAAVVCSATLGDLIESMIKRDLGIKDMGRLLPEHGGVLDRLDSLLATAPVVWLALQIFVPPS